MTWRLGMNDGNAFALETGLDLTNYLGLKLVLIDTGGRLAYGWIKEADAVESLGSDHVPDPGFDSACEIEWSCDSGWSIAAGVASCDGSLNVQILDIYNTAIVDGKLYKLVYEVTVYTSGTLYFYKRGDSVFPPATVTMSNGVASHTVYITATAGGTGKPSILSHSGAGWNGSLTSVSLKEVVHVGATGAHIVSAPGGSTRNWGSIESGFDPNNISAYTITRAAGMAKQGAGQYQT